MWRVIYHKEIENDLKLLGFSEVRKILKAIDEKIIRGEPDKIGKPLRGDLTGFRRIRVEDTRIVYRVKKKEVEVFIIAIEARRDNIIYKMTQKRTRLTKKTS